MSYSEILNTVVDNGRVLSNEDGSFQASSLIAEVEFEAEEQGLSSEEVQSAVEFALSHAEHDGE